MYYIIISCLADMYLSDYQMFSRYVVYSLYYNGI